MTKHSESHSYHSPLSILFYLDMNACILENGIKFHVNFDRRLNSIQCLISLVFLVVVP